MTHRKKRNTTNLKKITATILIFILIIQILPLVNLGAASHCTWYISPTGDDRNSGTITHPFKTLQKAIDASNNGDTIYLREGTYNKISSPSTGTLINRDGAPDSWYTIAGYPGERAVINEIGNNLYPNYALLRIGTATQGRSYIRITNLVIENSTQDGIRIAQQGTQTSHHIRIDNCTINNCAYHGLFFWSTNPNKAWCQNLTVEHCVINNTQTSFSMGEGVTFFGCKDVRFHHNILTNCPKIMLDFANNTKNCDVYENTIITSQGTGIKLDGSQSSTVSAWDENISIYNNHFSGTYIAIKIGVEKRGGCKNITIYNNIINTISSYPGLKLEEVIGYQQRLETIVIKQNTIQVSGAGSPLQIELPRTKLRHITIANNIFQGDGSASWQVRSSLSNFTDPCLHFFNNIYDHTTKPANTAWCDGKHKFEPTAIRSSPEFINRKAGDFSLNSNSPAIDTADPTYTVPFDYNRTIRPQNISYDIGAYEYIMIPPIPPAPPTITTVRITPGLQHQGGYLNISCEIIDSDKCVDTVWVTITNPDTTTQNYTMNPGYYLNQTYTQIGTYQFIISVHDTYNNTKISEQYMFDIIPVLTKAFIAGFVTIGNVSFDSLFSVKAKLLLHIEFNPLTITLLSSDETIYMTKESLGYIGMKFIIGAFNVAVFSEKNSHAQNHYRILDRFNRS